LNNQFFDMSSLSEPTDGGQASTLYAEGEHSLAAARGVSSSSQLLSQLDQPRSLHSAHATSILYQISSSVVHGSMASITD
jgi:hypothetical protein